MTETTLVTGGAGYVGAMIVDELLRAGHRVRVLDVLLHGQESVARGQESRGVEVVRGDVRDPDARRQALDGAHAVVHLAAIVGDPACAKDPELAQQVNVDATRALVDEARAGGANRFLFASTCSAYGRQGDPTVPIGEDGELSPVSLYAEQKVGIEQELLGGAADGLSPTCLRFSTVYGVSERMRFDLTVNEFSRDLWADRELQVFGEQFWRSYVHGRDAARAVRVVLEAPDERVAGDVFNVGDTAENYRKVDLVQAVQGQLGRGRVTYVKREEDPRDYQVNCDKIKDALGYETTMTVPDGIAEVLGALSEGAFHDPFDPSYRNIP